MHKNGKAFVIDLNKTDESVIDALEETIEWAERVADLTAFCVNDKKNATTVSVSIDDGDHILMDGEKFTIDYELIAKIERLTERKYAENRLNSMLLRMAQVGWTVHLDEEEGEHNYIDYGSSGSRDFKLTYEDIYAIEQELTVAEGRRYLIQRSHLPGFHKKIELGEAGFISSGKVIATAYTLENAKTAIKTAFPTAKEGIV